MADLQRNPTQAERGWPKVGGTWLWSSSIEPLARY